LNVEQQYMDDCVVCSVPYVNFFLVGDLELGYTSYHISTFIVRD
jgi:hypothetical protein